MGYNQVHDILRSYIPHTRPNVHVHASKSSWRHTLNELRQRELITTKWRLRLKLCYHHGYSINTHLINSGPRYTKTVNSAVSLFHTRITICARSYEPYSTIACEMQDVGARTPSIWLVTSNFRILMGLWLHFGQLRDEVQQIHLYTEFFWIVCSIEARDSSFF